MIRLLDHIFILRPLILIPVWDFFLIGYCLADPRRPLTSDLGLGLLAYTLIMGGVYILNQLADIDTDRANQKLFILSAGKMKPRAAIIEMFLVWTTGLVIAFHQGRQFAWLAVLSLVIGIAYSLKPVKLKGKPFLDMLSNALGYGMINFAVGWLVATPLAGSMWERFLPYCLSIAAVFVNTTVVDIAGDAAAGERTTAVLLGARTSQLFAAILMTCACVAALVRRDWICFIPAAVSLPLFLACAVMGFRAVGAPRRLVIASFRLPGLLFTVMTAYLFPAYLILLALVYVGLRLYYGARFHLNYPTLSGG